jgi:hypothetical protein
MAHLFIRKKHSLLIGCTNSKQLFFGFKEF